MYKRSSPLIILALLTLLVSACAVHWIRPEGTAVLIDSKHRAIISSELTEEKRKESAVYQRICSEPPPDVFSVLAASGGIGASKSGDKDLEASFWWKLAETAGTISRTQTVNLLRESMFRTCERYLNGAIDETQLIVQAARDQRAMIAVLAVEQLTQATRPPTVILGTNIESTAADLSEVKSDIEEREKALKELKEGECRDITKEGCEQKLEDAKKEVDEEKERYDIMRRLVSSSMSAQGSVFPSRDAQKLVNLAGTGHIATALHKAREDVKGKEAALKELKGKEKCRSSTKKDACESCSKKQNKQADRCERKLEEAKKELNDAQEHYNVMKDLAGTSKGVAAAVTDIVDKVMDFDEIESFCISNVTTSFRKLIDHKLESNNKVEHKDYENAVELTRELESKCRSLQHLAALKELTKNQKNSSNFFSMEELKEFLSFLEKEVVQTPSRECLEQREVIATVRDYTRDSEGNFDEGKFNELAKEFEKKGIANIDKLKEVVCSSKKELIDNMLIIPCHLREAIMKIVDERFTQRRNGEIAVIWNYLVDSRGNLKKANFKKLEKEVGEKRIPIPMNELRESAANLSRREFGKILRSNSISLGMLEQLATSCVKR